MANFDFKITGDWYWTKIGCKICWIYALFSISKFSNNEYNFKNNEILILKIKNWCNVGVISMIADSPELTFRRAIL